VVERKAGKRNHLDSLSSSDCVCWWHEATGRPHGRYHQAQVGSRRNGPGDNVGSTPQVRYREVSAALGLIGGTRHFLTRLLTQTRRVRVINSATHTEVGTANGDTSSARNVSVRNVQGQSALQRT